jgi:hypothetical protein
VDGTGWKGSTIAPVPLPLSRDQVLRFRARASHLHRKLPGGAYAEAAWGGLQDTVPRSGVISLHARVEKTQPDAWEDPSLVQIWFRAGADYVVPRRDVGVFTLGSAPRDPDKSAALESLADAVHRATGGALTKVRDLPPELRGAPTWGARRSSPTGRVHIRWDARDVWVIPVPRPEVDVEDARRELARRFLHWFGPASLRRLTLWSGVSPADARTTWAAIRDELVETAIDGDPAAEARFILAADIDAIRSAPPVVGVRLLPIDDPYTKLDHELLVPDASQRRRVLPKPSETPGYAPAAVLVDGEIVGAWQRQGRRATIHPFHRLSPAVREAIEAEALAFPIAGPGEAVVRWDEP